MFRLCFTLCASSLLLACSNGGSSSSPSISIDSSNARSISALGFQQFLALHSNEVLARNTIIANPSYASPCTSGGYSANFTDADNSNSLSRGDTVEENFSNCVLNTGNIRVSGSSSSSVNSFDSSTYQLTIQHSNLVVTTLGNDKSYTFDGPLRTTITVQNTLLNVDNDYRGYTVSFGSNTTTINAGTAFVVIDSLNNSYSIQHSLVFSTEGVSGILRTDTTSEVVGISADNEILLAGNPSLSAEDEEVIIQDKRDELAVENAKNTPDPAEVTRLELEIFDLEKAREAFRPFAGRLIIESVSDGQFVEMISVEDDVFEDNDPNTYQQNVRVDGQTLPTGGLKWTDLL